ARARPVLGHRARGDVDVHVALLQEVPGDPEALGVRAHVAEGRVRALLHDVTELTRQLHLPGAVHARRLDEEDLAADARPRQARSHARLLRALRDLARVLDGTEELPQVFLALDHTPSIVS